MNDSYTDSNYGRVPAGLFLLSIAFMVFAAGCNPGVVYEENRRIPGTVWDRDNVPVFGVNIDDTLSLHNLLINVRNTGEYPRSNLFLFISVTSPGGSSTRDTLELVLAEPSGKWKGSGFGSIWQNRFYYRRNVRFPERGIYVFEIEQAMRIADLPGITDIGLRVEKAGI
ncbi:MAG: gliding motility lipoprotein GldH [Marinilabiliales bacterium]|nr:MAG: gliding motility lipoprotein GldH [Marinilabiliales bacterium]